VAIFILKHLRRKVVRCSADSLFAFSFIVDLGSEAEVSNLKLHPLGEEQVSELEISVDDLVLVNVFHTLDELLDVVASFELVKTLASSHQVTKGLIVADVEHNVDVVFVFEVAVEANNVFVTQGAMDLDFTSQLLTGLASGEIRLADDFEGPSFVFVIVGLDGCNPADFVCFSEATLNRKKF
jgi:hypothetical protein